MLEPEVTKGLESERPAEQLREATEGCFSAAAHGTRSPQSSNSCAFSCRRPAKRMWRMRRPRLRFGLVQSAHEALSVIAQNQGGTGVLQVLGRTFG